MTLDSPLSFIGITHGCITSGLLIDDLSISRAHHGPRKVLSLHAHPMPCLIIVLEGTFQETFDGCRYTCVPGDTLFRPADAAHADHYGRNGATYLVLRFGQSVPPAVHRPELARIRLFRSHRWQPLARCIQQLGRDPCAGARFKLREMVWEVFDAEPVLPSAAQEPPPWVRAAYDRVHAEFRQRPSLSDLAASAHVHPDYLSRAFRHYFGFTISDLVRRRRIEHAAQAIRSSSRSLSGIACDAGFSDQSHLTREMKQHLGVTPGQLTQLSRQGVGTGRTAC